MDTISAVLLAILVASIAANAFQAHQARQLKRKPKLDLTAQDLLHDLTRRGGAMLRVEVIDPANLMLRSPRE
jgi:hypothetical protein